MCCCHSLHWAQIILSYPFFFQVYTCSFLVYWLGWRSKLVHRTNYSRIYSDVCFLVSRKNHLISGPSLHKRNIKCAKELNPIWSILESWNLFVFVYLSKFKVFKNIIKLFKNSYDKVYKTFKRSRHIVFSLFCSVKFKVLHIKFFLVSVWYNVVWIRSSWDHRLLCHFFK